MSSGQRAPVGAADPAGPPAAQGVASTRVQLSTTPVTARTLVRSDTTRCTDVGALRGHGVLDRADPVVAAVERADPADHRDAGRPVHVVLHDDRGVATDLVAGDLGAHAAGGR